MNSRWPGDLGASFEEFGSIEIDLFYKLRKISDVYYGIFE
jgi:hypothetical protein